jgi:transposase
LAWAELVISTKRYTDEFKIEAIRQIVECGRPVAEVAERLTEL